MRCQVILVEWQQPPSRFARDEPADAGLPTVAPAWFEQKRKEIEAMLEPIQVRKAIGPKVMRTMLQNVNGRLWKPPIKVPGFRTEQGICSWMATNLPTN